MVPTAAATAEAACCDVLVAGGGLTGTALALALSGAGLCVVLVESRPPLPGTRPAPVRPLAISEGSRRILVSLRVWQRIADDACPIRRVHVSDRGHFGCTRIDAHEHGVDALGQVVDAATVARALAAASTSAPLLRSVAPARVVGAAVGESSIGCRLETVDGESLPGLSARLLVVADGGQSALREQLGVGVREHDYGQVAVTAIVRPGRPHDDTAFERFTEHGPLALLPMTEGRCGLVWTLTPELVSGIAALDDAAFATRLGEAFGRRLGAFECASPRGVFPLVRTLSERPAGVRLAFIGNAAQGLHPVAGQGLNLGLRDVAWLAEEVATAMRAGEDPGAAAVLARYARRRRDDRRAVLGFTDLLLRVFCNRFPPLVLARGIALVATDLLPPLRHLLVRRAMGLAGRQPRLARGLPA